MKKNLIGLILIGMILFFSCNTKTKDVEEGFKRVEKYENGNIKELKIYKNQKEFDLDKNYKYFSYYSDGSPMEKASFRNGKFEGKCYYYEQDGSVTYMDSYKNGLLHGICKDYNKNGNIITEVLYIDNVKVSWKVFTIFEDLNMIGYQIFSIDSTNLGTQIGYYYVNNDYDLIKSKGNYYCVDKSVDTIKYGEEYKIEIEILISGGDTTYGEVMIGEINNKEEFKDSTSIIKLNFGDNKKVVFSTKEYELGDNLILGKVHVYQDTLIDNVEYFHHSEFLFYHEFFVKSQIGTVKR